MKNKDKSVFIKLLTASALLLMLVCAVLCLVFMLKNDISIKNLDTIALYFTGGTLTLAAVMIGLNVLKSFTLIFPPAFIYVLSGLIFDSFATAVFVNFIGTVISLALPYYLGRLTGIEGVNYLRERFGAVKKIDNFADANSFAVVFIVKFGLIPSDLSGLIFGAMGIPFGKYFAASNLACLALNFIWTLLGARGNLSDPHSWLYIIGAFALAFVSVAIFGVYIKRKKEENIK